MSKEIFQNRVSSLPIVAKPNYIYYVPNGQGTDLDCYVADKNGILRQVKPISSSSFILTNGNGTTANSTSVDLGGSILSNVIITSPAYPINLFEIDPSGLINIGDLIGSLNGAHITIDDPNDLIDIKANNVELLGSLHINSGTLQLNSLTYPSTDGIAGQAIVTDGANTLSFATVLTSESDPVYSASSWFSTTNNSSNWNTAYGWGNHASAGYLTSQISHADVVVDGDFTSQGIMLRGASSGTYSILTDNSSNWNTAFGWGNHASAGYLTSFSETDPIFSASAAFGITSGDITNWNSKQAAITTGTTAQYFRGDLSLATFPSIPSVGTWGTLNYPTWTTGTPFVKMTAAGTFSLDINTYLTTINGLNVSTLINDSGYITSSALSPYLTSATATSTYQPLLSGTGFVKSTAGTISYDTSTYLTTALAASTYQPLDSDLTTWAGITPGTGVGAALAINVGTAGAFVTNGGALGTPLSGTLTNCTFPILNQNTTGTAAGLTTARIINGSSFDGTADISVDIKIKAYQALGSTIKAQNVDGDLSNGVSGALMNSQRIYYIAVYLPIAATITGVKFIQITQGNYTANNYNGVGLFTYSGGTLTKVASSTDDGNIWKATSGTMSSKAFSSTYAASAGLYFVALMYSSSTQSQAPSLGILNTASTINTVTDFTNSAMTSALIIGQTALPSSTQAMSGLTAASTEYKVYLY